MAVSGTAASVVGGMKGKSSIVVVAQGFRGT